jgi:hypothetical protein
LVNPDVEAAEKLLREHAARTWRAPWLEWCLAMACVLIAAAFVIAQTREHGTVVVTRDVRRGERLQPDDLALASLPHVGGAFESRALLTDKKAARDLEAGQPLRASDVVPAAGATKGEVELPVRVFTGALRPKSGWVITLVATGKNNETLIAENARVVSVEGSGEDAVMTVALPEALGLRIASLREPAFHLLRRGKGTL